MIYDFSSEAVNSNELKERTMDFAVRVLMAANYRAALSAKSDADFIHKITIVLEEADESGFWIELAERAERLPTKRLKALHQESEELMKIFSATKRRAKPNQKS